MSETQGGSNVAIVALIVIAVLVAGAAFLFFGGAGGGGSGGNTNTVVERSVEKVTPDREPATKTDEGPGLSMSHESEDGQKTSIEANP
ncbi:MAG: hypothetical protein ACREUE_14070 [Panacagrimonas sp.]